MATVLLAGYARASTIAGGPRQDPLSSKQWGLRKISVNEAWKRTRGAGALVAVLDSGADLGHPDLKGNLVVRSGADMVDPDGKDGPQDEYFHGTHVSGIVAGVARNRIGISGIAPEAKILPVRVLNQNGSGTVEQVTAGIRFAIANHADVINLSLSMNSLSLGPVGDLAGVGVLQEAINEAWEDGIVIVAAAGNSGSLTCGDPGASEHVVCVGATGPNDELARYSSRDALQFDTYLVAPGGAGGCENEGILSTVLRSADGNKGCDSPQGYGYVSGTSMAAAMVSGAAALLSSQGLDNEEIVQSLIEHADDIGPTGRDSSFGYGRLNAGASVGAAS